MTLLPRTQLAWLLQKNRRRRQNAHAPVVLATLGPMGNNVSPALVSHPAFSFTGGSSYDSVSWDSSDFDVIDFDTAQAPLRFNLKAPGTATVTATFTNADGTTFATSRMFTVV